MSERARILMVAPHPDDEILGAGIWLHRHWQDALHVLHLTDGCPRDMADALAHGHSNGRAYVMARREEVANAMRMIPVPPRHCYRFDYPDKESYLYLPELIARLGRLIQRVDPTIVLSPAYEGGHPDHDTAAFAVAVLRGAEPRFTHLEYPLYHADAGGEMIAGEFLTDAAVVDESIQLTPTEQERKLRMLACFLTQQQMLSNFHMDRERLRHAPAYHFTEPPHAGTLLYEHWGWGIAGESWRTRVREVLATMERGNLLA